MEWSEIIAFGILGLGAAYLIIWMARIMWYGYPAPWRKQDRERS